MVLTVSDPTLTVPGGRDGLSRWLAEEAPGAVAGSGGHDATFTVACALWRMLADRAAVWSRLQEYNRTRCDPPWSEKELRHKLDEGDKATAGDPKRRSRSRNTAGTTRNARGANPGDIRAALTAPPRRYALPGRRALPRPAPRRATHEKPPEPVLELAAEGCDRDILKCGSCQKRRWFERWCDRHPRARKYHPATAHPCIRQDVIA